MIVQSLWIGDKLSIMEILCLKSFIKNNIIVHLYIYDNISNIPNNVIIKDANEILPKDDIFEYKGGGVSAFSNVFRYKLLYEKGGIWVDMDMFCIKPFNISANYAFSSEIYKDNSIHVNVGFIKAPKNSKLMLLCYKNSLIVKNNNPKWGDLGPKLFKKFVTKCNLTKYILSPHYFCPIGYKDIDKIINLDNNLNLINNSYCIHLWNGIWFKNNIDKNKLKNIIFFNR